MNTFFLKPKSGLTVIDPATRKPLAADGAEVSDTTYWRRRLADGDVERAEPSTTTKAKKATKKNPEA